MIRKPTRKIPYLHLLISLAVIGLALAAWQAGRQPLDPDWQSPVFVLEAEQTATPTPGWWEQTSPRPIVPTMPGRQAQSTPTPTEQP